MILKLLCSKNNSSGQGAVEEVVVVVVVVVVSVIDALINVPFQSLLDIIAYAIACESM